MKKKALEILLQKIPSPQQTNPALEQYITPATIAADILYFAYSLHNIKDKTIIDLGCGTGIFSIGAALLKAKQVIGVDVDKQLLEIASTFANKHNLVIEFLEQEVNVVDFRCDTVLMNPPFGAQKQNKNADRVFLQKACEISQIVYSLHLTKTLPFLQKLINSLGGEITHHKKYSFPIKGSFFFHKSEVKNFSVSLLRIKTK